MYVRVFGIVSTKFHLDMKRVLFRIYLGEMSRKKNHTLFLLCSVVSISAASFQVLTL